MIKVNMEKAREIHKNRLRSMREPLFAELDVAFLRAMERGDQAAVVEIVDKKQALRNVTAAPEITAASTPEELAAAIPAVLVQ